MNIRIAIKEDIPALVKLFDNIEYARVNNIDRLYTEASEFSKPLFEKFGFKIYEEEDIEHNSVMFHRYLMHAKTI